MTRKSFAIRHLKFSPPDEDTARKYLLQWQTGDLYHSPEAFPRLDSSSIFSNTQPLELEIGCGTGEFLCALATGEPETNFIGLDISLKSLFIAVEKARTLSLDNTRFIKAAVQFAYPLLVPGSLRAVYMHFPDPCLRPKYRKKRIFNRAFLDHVYIALADGGRLSVMTDLPELFESMLALVEQDARFEKTHGERYLQGFDLGVNSRYQGVWKKHGLAPLRFIVRKKM